MIFRYLKRTARLRHLCRKTTSQTYTKYLTMVEESDIGKHSCLLKKVNYFVVKKFIAQALGHYPEAGLLSKGSCFTRTLGGTKFINMRDVIFLTICFTT